MEFELPARRANPKGRFSHATGELDVDLDDLSHTTGGVSLDLTTIELTGNDGLVDAPNTAHALDWLELGAGIPATRRDTSARSRSQSARSTPAISWRRRAGSARRDAASS